MARFTGTVDLVNLRRGFARIIPADPSLGDCIFASIAGLDQIGINAGADVEYDLALGKKPGHIVAAHITLLKS